jgi:hypothetical protein
MFAKIIKLTCTCLVSPSQWEAELDNGEYLYVRYRWGGLSYGIGKDIDEAVTNSIGSSIKLGDDEYDGIMSEEQMLLVMEQLGIGNDATI